MSCVIVKPYMSLSTLNKLYELDAYHKYHQRFASAKTASLNRAVLLHVFTLCV
jgi:hypothetical protein